MKKITLSIAAIMTMSTFAIAETYPAYGPDSYKAKHEGGSYAGQEIDYDTNKAYIGLAYSYMNLNGSSLLSGEKIEIDIPDRDPTPEKTLIQSERSRMIEETIQALPERYRYVIILRHKEEKSYEEIAEIMNLPRGTVKAQIFRAREILNKNLKEALS